MNRFDHEIMLTQVMITIPGQGRFVIGPFTWEQEAEAENVYEAWLNVQRAAKGDRPGYGMTVSLMSYEPMLPSTDVGWLYSQYVQPYLPPAEG